MLQLNLINHPHDYGTLLIIWSLFSDGLSSYIHCNIDIMDPSTCKPKQGEHKKQKNKGKETKTDRVVQVSPCSQILTARLANPVSLTITYQSPSV